VQIQEAGAATGYGVLCALDGLIDHALHARTRLLLSFATWVDIRRRIGSVVDLTGTRLGASLCWLWTADTALVFLLDAGVVPFRNLKLPRYHQPSEFIIRAQPPDNLVLAEPVGLEAPAPIRP